jgi:hypothetical protein
MTTEPPLIEHPLFDLFQKIIGHWSVGIAPEVHPMSDPRSGSKVIIKANGSSSWITLVTDGYASAYLIVSSSREAALNESDGLIFKIQQDRGVTDAAARSLILIREEGYMIVHSRPLAREIGPSEERLADEIKAYIAISQLFQGRS